ncbi:MAG TPA: RsmE family RNA methyltransferase, partial [Nitrospiria bacterium]
MPVFFIESRDVVQNRIRLTGDLAHHLRDVLRFKPGEQLDLVDENRTRYRVALDSLSENTLTASILHTDASFLPSSLPIVLAQALLKGAKMDLVIQKATELGVRALVPVVTERTIVRPRPERMARQQERWQEIAREAAQQCGRRDIPVVRPISLLTDLCAAAPGNGLKLVPWEQEQENSLWKALNLYKSAGGFKNRPDTAQEEYSITILIGPEGGFSSMEI